MPVLPRSTYPPGLYLAVHSSDAAFLDFYRRACVGAESVLELGCGAGTISCALAADGHEVVGLDLRRDLVALAPRCDGVEFVVADMRDFGFPSGTWRPSVDLA